MGDKVYWKCREHTELGCWGRAHHPRAARATIMRGHPFTRPTRRGPGGPGARDRSGLAPALPEGLAGSQGPGSGVEEPLEGQGPGCASVEPECRPQARC